MAALVQTLPQQTTVTMLHGRPSSSGSFSPSHSQQHQPSRNTQVPRYHHSSNSSGSGSYRGLPSPGLSAPYAFTSTPPLANTSNISRQYQSPPPKSDNRTASAPVLPQIHSSPSLGTSIAAHSQYPLSSLSTSSSTSLQEQRSLGDASLSSRTNQTDLVNWPQTSSGLPSVGSVESVKPSPDRYRTNVRRDSGDSGTNRMKATATASGYSNLPQPSSSPALNTLTSYRGAIYNAGSQLRNSSADDLNVSRSNNTELAKRYRRRSLGGLETAGLNHSDDTEDTDSPHPVAFIPTSAQQTGSQDQQSKAQVQMPSSHIHKESLDSVSSTRSPRPGSAHSDAPSSPRQAVSGSVYVTPVSKQEVKIINIPQRPLDSNKRNPSPLSRPENATGSAVPAAEPQSSKSSPSPPSQAPKSIAAQHLAALSQNDAIKPKSKLRRAFSFGSATELRRATAHHNLEKSAAANPIPNPKRNSKYEDELEPEQAKIARKQEAGGIGESIYSGQGHFFTGSTDNLSISSTASSASLMLRKMGKGMKKSTRSLVGLFRPKSVIGVPAADGPVNQGSVAQVSMVNVEAEREKVNINVNPHDQPGGGTGFPKLERNSVDTKLSMDSGSASSDARSRRSIVGGERERAEVLAAVKKGILKRNDSGQSSPVTRPYDFKIPDFNLPQIPHINDSPRSSAPSTPADDHPARSGHRRTDSIAIEGVETDDYFASITRFTNIESKSAPPTPRGTIARNISFSPRIQFHDTWPPAEYDRRGEVATCNRLTPMLAQQIKEELNTFKMEMEVHESSKVYTHFF